MRVPATVQCEVTPAPKLNVALDNALHSIAAGSKQLKGCFVEGTFTTRNLAAA